MHLAWDDKTLRVSDGPIEGLTYYKTFVFAEHQTLRDVLDDLDALYMSESGFCPLVKCDWSEAEYGLNEDRVKEFELHLQETKRVAEESQ